MAKGLRRAVFLIVLTAFATVLAGAGYARAEGGPAKREQAKAELRAMEDRHTAERRALEDRCESDRRAMHERHKQEREALKKKHWGDKDKR